MRASPLEPFMFTCRDQGVEAFLLIQRRFETMHGTPRVQYSDPGSNFVAASKELKGFIESWDAATLERYGAGRGMDWKFHPPNAPHANRAVESMVKVTKKALSRTLGDNVFTFMELQTVLFEAAEVVN